MKLIDDLEAQLSRQDSFFRQHLMREDIARLRRLVELATEAENAAAFVHAGSYIGWTRDDMLTHRIKEPLEKLLVAVHDLLIHGATEQRETTLAAAWSEFNSERNDKLIKCL